MVGVWRDILSGLAHSKSAHVQNFQRGGAIRPFSFAMRSLSDCKADLVSA